MRKEMIKGRRAVKKAAAPFFYHYGATHLRTNAMIMIKNSSVVRRRTDIGGYFEDAL